jgi:hypothetical protein
MRTIKQGQNGDVLVTFGKTAEAVTTNGSDRGGAGGGV